MRRVRFAPLVIAPLAVAPLLAVTTACAPTVAQNDGRPSLRPGARSGPTLISGEPLVKPGVFEYAIPPQEAGPPAVPVFADGSVTTTDVNAITAVARAGDVDWLGTRFGLKSVDRRSGAIRYFTRRDNLPGDYVEAIAADAHRIYAAIRLPDRPAAGLPGAHRLAFGQLDLSNGKWSTLATVTLPREPLGRRETAQIALTDSAVVFAAPAVSWNDDAFVRIVPRNGGVNGPLRAIPLDDSLRADFDSVRVRFVRLASDLLIIGTDVGLLVHSVAGNGAWERWLPEVACDAAAVSEGTLWLSGHERPAPREMWMSDNGEKPPPARLWSIDLKTGVSTAAPPSPTAKDRPRPFGDRPAYPAAVAVDRDGAVWRTWLDGGASWSGGGLPAAGFERYDPKDKSWRLIPLTETPGARMNGARLPAGAAQTFARLPDPIVEPLTLSLAAFPPANSDDGPEASGLNRAGYWIRRRYPHWWTGQSASGRIVSRPARPAPAVVTDPNEERRLGRFPDPNDPNIIWTSQNGGSLFRVAHSDLAPISRAPDGRSFGLPPIPKAKAQEFTPPASHSLVAPHVGNLLPDSDSGLYVQTGEGLFHRLGDRWTKIEPQPQPLDANNHQVRIAGPHRTLFVRTDTGLKRVGPDDRLIDCGPIANDFSIEFGDSAGLYLHSGASEYSFLPVAADGAVGAVQKIAPGVPTEVKPINNMAPRFFAAAGGMLWTRTEVTGLVGATMTSHFSGGEGSSVLIGWDVTKKRWSAPLELDPFYGGTNPVVTEVDGGVAVVRAGRGGDVSRYNPAQNRWERVAPAPTGKQDDKLRLLSLRGHTAVLADNESLYRYADGSWSRAPLPARLQTPFPPRFLTVDRPDASFLGSEVGLWSIDRSTLRATEAQFGLNSDAGGRSLSLLSVDHAAVWGWAQTHGNPPQSSIFRFDKTKKTFAFFDSADGVPSGYTSSAVGDGSGLWMLNQNGVWRLDSRSGKARRALEKPVFAASADPSAPGVIWLVGSDGLWRGLPDGSVRRVSSRGGIALRVEQGAVLVGADQLYRVDKRSGAFRPVALPPGSPNLGQIGYIRRAPDGVLEVLDFKGENTVRLPAERTPAESGR